jgi:hypothetical protein
MKKSSGQGLKNMSKATNTEIKELIGAIDRKIDLLTQEASSIRGTVDEIDDRLWAFGSLILVACLGVFLKTRNL